MVEIIFFPDYYTFLTVPHFKSVALLLLSKSEYANKSAKFHINYLPDNSSISLIID
jgi:hypothetical protein